MTLDKLADEIIAGRRLKMASAAFGKEDGTPNLLQAELGEATAGADWIRKALCGDNGDLCPIVHGKSGRCGEDCKFCAQFCYNHAGIDEHGFPAEDRAMLANLGFSLRSLKRREATRRLRPIDSK